MDFSDKMHLRGKAEEDLYFARLDKLLIDAMHEKQTAQRHHLQDKHEERLDSDKANNA